MVFEFWYIIGLLPDTENCGLCVHRECRERFPHHRLKRKPPVSDPGMHHGTCITHVRWCMSGSLTPSGGENVSRHSRRMRNPQFYVSGKRPIGLTISSRIHEQSIEPSIIAVTMPPCVSEMVSRRQKSIYWLLNFLYHGINRKTVVTLHGRQTSFGRSGWHKHIATYFSHCTESYVLVYGPCMVVPRKWTKIWWSATTT